LIFIALFTEKKKNLNYFVFYLSPKFFTCMYHTKVIVLLSLASHIFPALFHCIVNFEAKQIKYKLSHVLNVLNMFLKKTLTP